MNNQPLVSVVLCTYNGCKFIDEQLQSILAQTYKNLEIVIVDDTSTDNTLEILNNFQLLDARIKIYKNTVNIGYNKNFQKAAMLANGEYIAIADQDDIWDITKIECLMQCWKDPLTLMVTCESALFSNGQKPNLKSIKNKKSFRGNNVKCFFLYNQVSGHNMLIHKRLLLLAMPFPDDIFYDWWLCFVACANGKIETTKKVLVYHRMHSDSATSKALQNRHPSILTLQRLPILLSAPNLSLNDKQTGLKLLEKLSNLKNNTLSLSSLFFIYKNGRHFFYQKKKWFPYFSYLKHAYRWSKKSY